MTNSFKNIRTEFRTKVNLNKEECIEVATPFVKCALLSTLKHKHKCNGHWEGYD